MAAMSSGVVPQQPPMIEAPASRQAFDPTPKSGRGPSAIQTLRAASHVDPRFGYARSGLRDPVAERSSDGMYPGGVQLTPTATTLGLDDASAAASENGVPSLIRTSSRQEKLIQARQFLAECAREVEVLEKHRDKVEARYVQQVEKKEANELDEIGAHLFISKRRLT